MLKRKIISCLLTALILIPSTNCFAKQRDNGIPTYMNPGSVITYDKNNNMVILKDGISVDTRSLNTGIELSLPKPEPGMTICYDGTGLPTKIKVGDGYLNFNSQGMTTSQDTTTMSQNTAIESSSLIQSSVVIGPDVSWEATGWITWFDDYYGQQDHVLGDYDCATKIGMYEPPCGTNVVVYDPNHNTNRVLTKWDIGTLPNAVLDIRPYAFSNLFGYNLGDGHFWSRYGYYVQ